MASAQHKKLIADLNQCLSTLTHSLADYVLNSGAYVCDADKDAVGTMREIAAHDAKFAERAVRIIDDLRGISQLSVTNPDYGHLNYLSYPYLLDVMIAHRREQIEIYRGLVENVGNYADVRRLYRDVLQAHEAQLAKVEGIRQNRYKSAEPEPEPEPDTPEEASADESGAGEAAPEQAPADADA